jgi:hypothetical protein
MQPLSGLSPCRPTHLLTLDTAHKRASVRFLLGPHGDTGRT